MVNSNTTYTFGTAAVRYEQTAAEAFLSLLTIDDRDSYYCVASRDEAGKWSEAFVKAGALREFSLFDDACDWYVSRNGFTQKSRKSERLRQINAIMFDLDCHAGDFRAAVDSGLHAIAAAVNDGALPEPNMVVDTGRGLHVYYVLRRSASYRLRSGAENLAGIEMFRDVEGKLENALAKVVEGTGLEPDRAVYDFSRVGRIPGTYNAAAGRYATLAHYNDNPYDLPTLTHYGSKAAKPATPRRRNARILNFDRLAISRVGKIFELQKVRGYDCLGHRELMCFCLYNAAVQLFSDRADAVAKLDEFNSQFNTPVAANEIIGIIRSVDKVGYYKMSAAVIAAKLGMSSEEIARTNFFESRRATERALAKAKTAEKKKERNARILALYSVPGATYDSVAKDAGVCRATVAAVLRDAKTAQNGKKPLRSLADLARLALSSASVSQQSNFLAHVFRVCEAVASSNGLAAGFQGDSLAYSLGYSPP